MEENNTYKITITIEDWNGKMTYSKESEGDAPYAYDFANFCHDAGLAYGFSPNTMNNLIPYQWD